MKIIFSALLIVTVLLGPAVFATAGQPVPSEAGPLTDRGVRYVPGAGPVEKKPVGITIWAGWIDAYDDESGELLWRQKIYEKPVYEAVDQESQKVLIAKMKVEKNKLVIINSELEEYSLDLKTREVERVS